MGTDSRNGAESPCARASRASHIRGPQPGGRRRTCSPSTDLQSWGGWARCALRDPQAAAAYRLGRPAMTACARVGIFSWTPLLRLSWDDPFDVDGLDHWPAFWAA